VARIDAGPRTFDDAHRPGRGRRERGRVRRAGSAGSAANVPAPSGRPGARTSLLRRRRGCSPDEAAAPTATPAERGRWEAGARQGDVRPGLWLADAARAVRAPRWVAASSPSSRVREPRREAFSATEPRGVHAPPRRDGAVRRSGSERHDRRRPEEPQAAPAAAVAREAAVPATAAEAAPSRGRRSRSHPPCGEPPGEGTAQFPPARRSDRPCRRRRLRRSASRRPRRSSRGGRASPTSRRPSGQSGTTPVSAAGPRRRRSHPQATGRPNRSEPRRRSRGADRPCKDRLPRRKA
jgi:hypothetical protein